MVTPQFSWDAFPAQSQRGIPKQSKPIESAPPVENEPAPKEVDTEGNAPGQQPEPEFSWGQFDTPTSYFQAQEDEEEGPIEGLTRNVVSNVFRLGEQYAGKRGNLIEFGKNMIADFPQLAGFMGSAIESFIGPEKWKKFVKGDEESNLLGSSKLPTSEDLKGLTETFTGKYTEPKGPVEKGVQDFLGDVGATLTGRQPNLRAHGINSFAIPAAANAMKQTVGWLGFGEDKATMTKLAGWTALSLLGNVNGREYASQQVREARNALPNNLTVDLNRYLTRLDALERRFLASDPRSQAARQQIGAIRQDIQNGQTSIHDLLTQYDGINAVRNTRGFFDIGRGPARESASRNLDEVRYVVRDMINETGNQYPQALQQWRNGMQSLAVINQSQRMTNYIKDVLQGPYAKIASGAVSGLFGAATYFNPAAATGAATGTAAGYKVYQVAHRVWNDPRLREYYWNAIAAAQAENTPVFIKNIKALDEAYNEKERKKSFVM
jgi:hypothetical protein